MKRFFLLLSVLCFSSAGFAQDEQAQVSKAAAEKFRAMETLARRTQVVVLKDGKEVPAVLRADPLMKYGDEFRKIKESTLWVWMDGQQPVAFQKIEVNVWNGPENPFWTFCVSSTTEQQLKISWPFHPESFLTEPVSFADLDGIDVNTHHETTFKLQLRSLMRDVSVIEGTGNKTEEIRLLPQPLLSMADPDHGVHGAVFGYAVGTNPDALVIMRTVNDAGGSPRLQCGVAQMTSAALSARFRETEIYRGPGRGSGLRGTWGYFFSHVKVSE